MRQPGETKINALLKGWPPGTVYLSSWLAENGISGQLLHQYKKNKWVDSVGSGAVIRSGSKVDYFGALYALQNQAGMSVHVGGRTALSLLGQGHYLELSPKRAVLFGAANEVLPHWFRSYNWGVRLDYFATSFLPPDTGLVSLDLLNFTVRISCPVRAMLECLYLSPKHQEMYECFELMQGLNNLRPQIVQQLLETCSSIRVKRLFLYLAEKFDHQWLEFLDLSRVSLGSGKRSLVKGGAYIDKYKITVPREFEKSEQPYL